MGQMNLFPGEQNQSQLMLIQDILKEEPKTQYSSQTYGAKRLSAKPKPVAKARDNRSQPSSDLSRKVLVKQNNSIFDQYYKAQRPPLV